MADAKSDETLGIDMPVDYQIIPNPPRSLDTGQLLVMGAATQERGYAAGLPRLSPRLRRLGYLALARYLQLKREVAGGFGVVGCGVYGVGAGLDGFGYRSRACIGGSRFALYRAAGSRAV